MIANEVRIIGGIHKGRKLRFPDVPDLRPTLGRVRETLFNWLAPYIDGSRCLDLFAGSGALGFEALSRGARHVTLVESNRRALAALRENAARLGCDASRAEIVGLPAERVLRRPGEAFDIIFLDPPFAADALDTSVALIHRERRLATGGFIYFELPRRADAAFDHYTMYRQGTAGDTRFGLLRETATLPAEPVATAPRAAD